MEKILRLLADYPGIYYTYMGRSLTVYPDSSKGFTVSVISAGKMQYDVHINNLWHVFTCSKAEMVQHVINAISGVYRIRVEKKGNWIVRLGLEQNRDGRWEEIANALLPVTTHPFNKRTEYWQNTTLKKTSALVDTTKE